MQPPLNYNPGPDIRALNQDLSIQRQRLTHKLSEAAEVAARHRIADLDEALNHAHARGSHVPAME
jgi:hypothetical protein